MGGLGGRISYLGGRTGGISYLDGWAGSAIEFLEGEAEELTEIFTLGL